MDDTEVCKLLDRVRVHYQNMAKADEVSEEWYRVLKNYKCEEVVKKLDEYLQDEIKRKKIPSPFDLVDGLLTLNKKEKLKNDYLIDCNLCHKTMLLNEYNSTHYKKCLLIKALIRKLSKEGTKVTYQDLDNYSYERLDKLYDKYYEKEQKVRIEGIRKLC